jgi:CRP/FNR family cyclic AMP-dependent transcriptional regulator
MAVLEAGPGGATTPAQSGLARRSALRLLDVDPELGSGLPERELALATRHLVVPRIGAAAGTWHPPLDVRDAIGLLVVEGVLTRDGFAFDRPDLQLFGAGDVIDARSLPGGTWRVLCDATLAVLDQRVIMAGRRWPELVAGVARRLLDGQHEQHRLAAIATRPRVEDRLLSLLTHLASRWGCVTLAGLTLDLPTTHETLGRLVGARRPTVSLAIGELTQNGALRRLPDGRWLIPATGTPERPAA